MKRLIFLVFCVCSFHAMAQSGPSASSNLSGAWLQSELPEGELSFLTIVHREDRQLLIMSSDLGEFLGLEIFISAPILGRAGPAALGADIGSGESVASYFLGLEVAFTIDRPAEDRIDLTPTSCKVVVDIASCDDLTTALGEPISYMRVF